MQKEAIARFAAISISASLAYAGYKDFIPVDTSKPESELIQTNLEK